MAEVEKRAELKRRFMKAETWEDTEQAAREMQHSGELPNSIAAALLSAYSQSDWRKKEGGPVRVADVQDLMREVYGIPEDLTSFISSHLKRSSELISQAYAWMEEYEGLCNSVGLAFVAGVRTVGSTDFSCAFGMTQELDALMNEIKGALKR